VFSFDDLGRALVKQADNDKLLKEFEQIKTDNKLALAKVRSEIAQADRFREADASSFFFHLQAHRVRAWLQGRPYSPVHNPNQGENKNIYSFSRASADLPLVSAIE
jgi:hypothetical protein